MPYKDPDAKRTYQRAYMQAYRVANRAQLDEKRRVRYVANKEQIAAKRLAYKSANRATINAKERARYHTAKADKKELWKTRWTRYNRARPAKTLARNEVLLGRKKSDACEACGGNDGGIVFDHCHERGHPRGWLCDRCNVTLGMAKDSIPRLRKLIAYLERNRENTSPQLTLSGI